MVKHLIIAAFRRQMITYLKVATCGSMPNELANQSGSLDKELTDSAWAKWPLPVMS